MDSRDRELVQLLEEAAHRLRVTIRILELEGDDVEELEELLETLELWRDRA